MSLRDLGLLPLHETLYRLLLADPAVTVPDLARRAGTDGASAQAGLDRLADLALTYPDAGAPCGAVARRPAVALGRLAEQRTLELSSQLRAVLDTHADIVAIDELTSPPGRGGSAASNLDGVPGFEVVRGRAAISQRLDDLALASRGSLDSITPAPPRGSPVLGTGMSMRRSANHGVRIRWVFEPQLLGDEFNATYVRESLEAGVALRAQAGLLSRVIIADGTTAIVPIDVDHKDDGVVVITHPLLLLGVQAYFDRVWRESRPLELVRGEPAVSPARTAREELDLLTALATHSTDETAARVAGISDRQFRRRLNSAMTALGAKNRFQAGVLAERHGLLGESATPAP